MGFHKLCGDNAFIAKKAGRPRQPINPTFSQKVIDIRNCDDYLSL